MINVLIGGDLCPINRNLTFFKNGNINEIFNDFLNEFKSVDLSIVNLECPFISEPSPITIPGINLGVDSACINGVCNAGISLVNLANNHILDHGSKGLTNTIRLCNSHGIATVGAGKNLESARKPFIREIKGMVIGVMGIAAREFSIADKDSSGANPIDLIYTIPDLLKLKDEVDYIIILIHAGPEYHLYPSPKLMELCRLLVELGARCIVCQHSHYPGCFEEYKNGYIIYSQGNLLFDWLPPPNKEWNLGYLLKVQINEKDRTNTINIIPYIQSGVNPGLKKMDSNEEANFLFEINKRSLNLIQHDYITDQWEKYCSEMESAYLSKIIFNNKLLRKISSRFFFHKLLFTKKRKRLLLNLIRCEDHREVLETILDVAKQNKNK